MQETTIDPLGARSRVDTGTAVNSAMSLALSVIQVKAIKRRRLRSSNSDHCASEGSPRTEGLGSVNFSVTYFC